MGSLSLERIAVLLTSLHGFFSRLLGRLPSMSFTAFRLIMPRHVLEPVVSLAELMPQRWSFGSVLVVRVEEPVAEWDYCAVIIAVFRRRTPGVPIVVWAVGASLAEFEAAAAGARDLGVRAIVRGTPLEVESVRRQLTDAGHLAADVIRYLAEFNLVYNGEEDILRIILDGAPNHRTVGDLARESGCSLRTWRYRMRFNPAGSPSRWFNLARALHAMLALQRSPRASIESVALSMGYADGATFSRQCTHLFGGRPGHLRLTLGWEPLLSSWLERSVWGGRQPWTQ